MTEKKFNKIFSAFILTGMTVAMVITTIFKMNAAETGKVLLIISAFGSLMGVLSTVAASLGSIWTFFFGFIDVSLYAVMCFIGTKYGNAFLHALYFVPMQFVGFYQWKKRGAGGSSQVKARRLDSKLWLLYSIVFLAGSIVAYLILSQFNQEQAGKFLKIAVVLDVLPMMCNIIGQWLMSNAYMEQWIFWIGVNVTTILMWSTTYAKTPDSYALIYIIKYSFYLLNSLNGLRIWIKLSRPESSC